MKKIILPIVVLAFLGFGLINPGLSVEERKMTTDHLLQTQERVTSTLEGLSEAQLNFKATPESWSVAEIVEHLAISENMFSGMLEGAMKEPANPAMRDSVTMTDEKLIGFISVRDTKIKTPEPFEPTGKFGTYEETLKTFSAKRKEHVEFISSTEADLRNHYGKLPFATIDGLQIVLFMSGHTERHVKQMEEVKANENFPAE